MGTESKDPAGGEGVNPHIPQFMSSAPWYAAAGDTPLGHQKNWKGAGPREESVWAARVRKTFQATKFRKGACENCGSMTHKSAECLERPRKVGAKWTGEDIAADEEVEDAGGESYDAKRDRYRGYDPEDYQQTVARFERIQELQQKAVIKKLMEEENLTAEEAARKAEEALLEAARVDAKQEDTGAFAKVEKRVRQGGGGGSAGTVRNLRIREDTAKYLLNLDLDSAYYDPKSRSMREDPTPHLSAKEKVFAGENFEKASGEFREWLLLQEQAQKAWSMGVDMHTHAAPSQAELLRRQFLEKRKALATNQKSGVLEKYGNVAEEEPEELREMQQTEAYVEYDRAGRVKLGKESRVFSRYKEDVFPGNHSSVWGSWWHAGRWGYRCCHATARNAWCTGEAGVRAEAEKEARMERNVERREAEREAKKDREGGEGAGAGAGASGAAKGQGRDMYGRELTLDEEVDPGKLKEALEREERRLREQREGEGVDGRKRKYMTPGSTDGMTVEELEAFQMKRVRADDPMAQMKGDDSLL